MSGPPDCTYEGRDSRTLVSEAPNLVEANDLVI